MRIGIDRRGSRNTLRLFRFPYVKYSTGANLTTRVIFHALRKPDSTVARQGVRTTDGVTITRKMERHAFSRVSAISRPAPLFCILFSGKTEKSMPPEAQLQRRCKNSTSGESGKRCHPFGRKKPPASFGCSYFASFGRSGGLPPAPSMVRGPFRRLR